MKWPAVWVFRLLPFFNTGAMWTLRHQRASDYCNKEEIPCNLALFYAVSTNDLPCHSNYCSHRRFGVCSVCVWWVNERRNTCNDIRMSSDTPHPPLPPARLSRSQRPAETRQRSLGYELLMGSSGRSRTGESLNIQTEWARSSWPQITWLPLRNRSSWQRLRWFAAFLTTRAARAAFAPAVEKSLTKQAATSAIMTLLWAVLGQSADNIAKLPMLSPISP